jgi:hypothetical protein
MSRSHDLPEFRPLGYDEAPTLGRITSQRSGLVREPPVSHYFDDSSPSLVGGYDEFSERSYPDYVGGTSVQRWHRELLRQSMEAEGFRVYEFEWWHFDYTDWARYPILNFTFEQLDTLPSWN